MEMLKSANDKYVAREMPLEPTKEGLCDAKGQNNKKKFKTFKF